MEAKHWPDEQEAHTRRRRWIKGHSYLKSYHCTENGDVNATGISGKEVRMTRGDLFPRHRLGAVRTVPIRKQKSAEGIVGGQHL